MRVIVTICCSLLLVCLLAGCSDLPATQPLVTMTEPLAPVTFDAARHAPAVHHVDLTNDARWQNECDRLSRIEGFRLAFAVTPAEDDARPTRIAIYISDARTLTAATITQAEYLTTCALPGSRIPLQFDSGYTRVSPRADALLRGGVFSLYLLPDSATNAALSQLKFSLQARVGVL